MTEVRCDPGSSVICSRVSPHTVSSHGLPLLQASTFFLPWLYAEISDDWPRATASSWRTACSRPQDGDRESPRDRLAPAGRGGSSRNRTRSAFRRVTEQVLRVTNPVRFAGPPGCTLMPRNSLDQALLLASSSSPPESSVRLAHTTLTPPATEEILQRYRSVPLEIRAEMPGTRARGQRRAEKRLPRSMGSSPTVLFRSPNKREAGGTRLLKDIVCAGLSRQTARSFAPLSRSTPARRKRPAALAAAQLRGDHLWVQVQEGGARKDFDFSRRVMSRAKHRACGANSRTQFHTRGSSTTP